MSASLCVIACRLVKVTATCENNIAKSADTANALLNKYSRGYIIKWLRGDVIPEKSAMKIFGAADRILKAG